MGEAWQKTQLQLAFMAGTTGEARRPGQLRAESPIAGHGTERLLCTKRLMEELVHEENAKRALRRFEETTGVRESTG